MKAKENVNETQETSEKINKALRLFNRSAKDPNNGALKNSTMGRQPTKIPLWLGFIPSCLKYTPRRGKNEPTAPQ